MKLNQLRVVAVVPDVLEGPTAVRVELERGAPLPIPENAVADPTLVFAFRTLPVRPWLGEDVVRKDGARFMEVGWCTVYGGWRGLTRPSSDPWARDIRGASAQSQAEQADPRVCPASPHGRERTRLPE